MGDLKAQFAPRHDVVIFATKGRFEFPGKRPDDVIACPKVGNSSLIHPNEKPVALLERLIEATTEPGALILDPFAGSGSTLAAAVKTGRQYISCEIVPGAEATDAGYRPHWATCPQAGQFKRGGRAR